MKIIHKIILIASLLNASATFAQKSLSLGECKTLAVQNNSQSKNSRLEIQAASETKKSAFTNYFPHISASGLFFRASENMMEMKTKGGNLPVYDGNPVNLMTPTQFAYFPSSVTGLLKKGDMAFVNIAQPVYAGGRIVNGNKLAALGEEVSTLKSRQTRDEILRKTEEQYWLVVSLDEKYNTILKYEELLRKLLNQVDDAYNNGIVTRNDLLKVRLKLSEVLLNKSKLNNGREIAAMAFCQYIGIVYDSSLVLKDDFEVKNIPQSYYIDHSEALKLRSEYRLLEKSVEAEKLLTKMKLGEYLPQVSVGVSGVYQKFDEGDKQTLGMVFGNISVPISDWWGGSHSLQEREIREEMAQNDFQNNSELLTLQMQKSWQDLNDAYKQYLLSEEAKSQAEENLRVNDDSYKNGMVNVSDLLDAQALYQQSKEQLTEARTGFRIKIMNYLIATGRN
ncbi:MAG: TolC family protein [Bacteroidota bacterium]